MLNELRWKEFPVLEHGSVALVDVMGDDAAIADAARNSFGKGTRSVSDDRTLIRMLMRRDHATPFEMAELKLALRVPNGDVWRQMIRHRAASIRDEASMWDEPSINAYSYRYSEAEDLYEATRPEAWRSQSKGNKQGSEGLVTEWPEGYRIIEDASYDEDEDRIRAGEGDDTFLVRPDGTFRRYFDGHIPTPGEYLTEDESTLIAMAQAVYKQRLEFGVAREQARKDLPNSILTTAYWKCDLRNVLHYLWLRMDSHAQAETRAYAETIGHKIVAPLFPATWEAFLDYRLNAITLSSLDVEVLRHVASGCDLDSALLGLVHNARERDECRAKLDRLRLGKVGEANFP